MVYKRYLSVTIMVFACFISSFITLFEGMSTIVQAHKKADDMYLYGYHKSMCMYINSAYEFKSEDLLKLKNLIKNCNVILENMYFYFDGDDDVLFNPVILIAQNEVLPIPTENEIKELPDDCIVIPKSVEVSGDTLYIHGNPLRIAGIIDDSEHYSDEMRYTLNGETYFANYVDTFDGNNFVLRVSSNEHDPYEQCVGIESFLKNISPHFQVEYSEKNYDKNLFSYADDDSVLISGLLYLFALINAAIVSFYRVTVRKKEIGIRKAFGATNIRICGKMFAEFIAIIGTAAIISFVIGAFMHITKNGIGSISDYFYISIGYFAFILIAAFISLIIPLKKIINTEPVEGVCE